MCCFSRAVKFVGGTRIFVRGLEDGRQHIVYAMDVEIDSPLAMVLPLPVPAGVADDAVTFVDLEAYGGFFDDLERAFPPDYTAMPQSKGPIARGAPPKQTLVVHDVGAFEASFVPTRADFARLDARFRMPEDVFAQHAAYADHGFAVFQLAPEKGGFFGTASKRQRIHPMAFTFPRREPDALFFPTLHVHDGVVTESARFDHMLYCQVDGVLGETLDWTPSTTPLDAHVDTARAHGLVLGEARGRRTSMFGTLPNADVVLRAPRGVRTEDLTGEGETFRYRVRAGSAYAHAPGDPMRVAWRETARHALPALCRGLREGLPALVTRERDGWALTTLDDTLPRHFVNGDVLYTGTSYRDGHPAVPGGPGQIAIRVFSDRVEPQDVTLGFARLPDRPKLDAIRAALRALVDRAVG